MRPFPEKGASRSTGLLASWRGGIQASPNRRSRQSHLSAYVLMAIRTRIAGAGEDSRYSSSRSIDCILERDDYSVRVLGYQGTGVVG